MKKSAVVLVVSLLANVALIALFLGRGVGGREAASTSAVVEPSAPEVAARLSAAQLAALASGDVQAMKAAGFPTEIARQLAVGRAYARMQARTNAVKGTVTPNRDYWSGLGSGLTKQQWAEVTKAQSEFTGALREALGEEASEIASPFPQYAFLPAAKRDQLLRIEQDYQEMEREVVATMQGFQLPADDQKLKLLAAEKQRDLMAALTPEEREQFELRESPMAHNIRGNFSGGIRSEADYLKIFALQKAFDDRYGSVSQDWLSRPSEEATAARNEAALKLRDDLHAALGDEGYAVLRRAGENDYKSLNALARRFEVPAATVDAVCASRDQDAELSQSISRDPTLPPDEQSKQIQGLAARAHADLQAALGPEAAELYAQRAAWLATLNDGRPVSTDLRLLPGGLWIQEPRVARAPAKPSPPAPGSQPKG
jgi:hypothetical protein